MKCFDESYLRAQLEALPSRVAVAFSAAVAMRQVENYESFARIEGRDVKLLREILLQLWGAVPSLADRDLLTSNLEAAMSLLPSDEAEGVLAVFAEDAVSSVAYAIRFQLTDDLQEAIWAVRRAYEAADQAAIALLDIQPGSPASEATILQHPIVQRELTRQHRDLSLLSAGALDEVRQLAFDERMFTVQESAALRLL